MPLSGLERDLSDGLKPVYLLAGPQSFQLQMAIDRVLTAIPDGGMRELNRDVFRAGQDDLSELVRLANSMPMLASARIIILHDIHRLKAKERENLSQYLVSPAPFTHLLLSTPKLDARTTLTKLVKKHGFVLQFDRLYESRMRPWLRIIANDQGVTLEPDAMEYLIRNVGADLAAVAKEVEKAAIHAGTDRVGIDNLTAVLTSVKEQSSFALMDAMSARDTVKALIMLKQMLEQGESPLAILAVIGRQLRQLIVGKQMLMEKAKENEISNALGVPPFIAKKVIGQARQFNAESLRKGLILLSRTDLELKDGRCSDQAILEKYILALCRRG